MFRLALGDLVWIFLEMASDLGVESVLPPLREMGYMCSLFDSPDSSFFP